MRVIGLMSGTSCDGIEGAAADLELAANELILQPLGERRHPYDSGLREAIAAALPPMPTTAQAICELHTRIGQAFADIAQEMVELVCGGRADLVVSHGQTVFHWVEEEPGRSAAGGRVLVEALPGQEPGRSVAGGRVLGTLQLGQPAWIAERTGVPVVSDLRSRDVAAGGLGAPLVSLVDALLLPPGPRPKAALNLGGIANLTIIPPDGPPLAFDVGPANALIDAAVTLVTDGAHALDQDGARAARGRIRQDLLARLLADPYYEVRPPKTTGKERFNLPYLLEALREVGETPGMPSDDLIATVTAHAAETIARDCTRYGVEEVFVAGGGTRNPTLMGMLAMRTPGVNLLEVEELGIPSTAKEAYAFAVLGFLTVCGLPGTMPSCTGARHPSVLGSITPGRGPLRLPSSTAPPRRLRIVPRRVAPPPETVET